MSLDLSGKTGRAHNAVALAAADFSGVLAATFDSGDLMQAGSLMLHVNLTANAMDVNTMPTTLLDGANEILVDGMKLTIIKGDSSGNNLTFTDPVTGVTYTYVDRQGESLSLVFDTSDGGGPRWVAAV